MANLHTDKSIFGISKKKLLWYVYLIILTPICLELALRVISAKPYIQEVYYIEVTPKNAFLGNKTLGISLNPGTYHITLNKKHSFTATHTQNKQRLVSFVNYRDSISPTIGVFGCSFTYGYGVNDSEHFVSILQKQYPNKNFANFGVIGYGTTQSYLQLLELEKNNKIPQLVILNFATDHFERNALTNIYRRALKIGFNQSLETAKTIMKNSRYPYLQNSKLEISFENWEDLYQDWYGRQLFASVNWLQTKGDEISDNQKDIINISHTLINEMDTICKRNNTHFLVALLDNNTHSETLKRHLKNSNIHFIDIGFNFNNKQLTNHPYDNHPNPLGHEFIAKKINTPLKTLLERD